MLRRVTSPTYAFCASLAVHAAIVHALAISYVHAFGTIYLPGFSASENPNPTAVVAIRPPSADAQDTPLGELNGTGNSIDPMEGDQPHEAPHAEQSQMFLSRDPAGPGTVGNLPSMSVLPEGPSAKPLDDSANADTGAMIGVPATAADAPLPAKLAKTQASDRGAAASDDPVVATAAATPAAIPAAPPTARSDPPHEMLAAPVPPADPAPMAESETDPFSVKDGVRFIRGREAAQFGRKHKLVRPRLTLAGQTALLELPAPVIVVLRLHLDAAGNVTRAEILHSSGSGEIDLPCKVAAYQWGLEPTRDRSGNAVPDVVPFVIRFD
jgi:hypothetical protein